MRQPVSPRLMVWAEDRAKYVRIALEEMLDPSTGVWTAIDISASTAKVYLRCWKAPTAGRVLADVLINDAMTKESDGSGSTDAVVTVTSTITTATGRPGPLEFEVVLVDETVTGEPTPSTYQERVLLTWGSADGAKLLSSLQP